jgi:hypothetical protein
MGMITVMTLGFLLALGAAGSFAEEGDHAGHEPQAGAHQDTSGSHSGMGMGMGHGMGRESAQMGHSAMQHDMDMHERMRTLHDHSKMMAGITDQKKLADEMKKHTRMLNDMIEQMTQTTGEPAPTEAPGETP